MPNPSLSINALTAKTLSEFIKLTKAYFQELDIVPEFFALDQDLTHPLIAYALPRGCFWLATATDKPHAVGMIGILPLARKTCELKRLYIAPDYRRKKWGLKLLEQAVNFARQAEYYEVLVALHHDQKSALTLFEDFGFIPCARFSEHHHSGIFLSLKLNE